MFDCGSWIVDSWVQLRAYWVDDRTMRPVTADTLVGPEERNRTSPEEKAGVAAELGPEHAIGDTANTTASGPALEAPAHKISLSSLSSLPPQNQEALSGRYPRHMST
jgi:hypothetical protein